MGILLESDYQFRVVEVSDRAWLEAAMTTGIYTPDDAISYIGEWDGVSDSIPSNTHVHFSVIISKVSDNIPLAWFLTHIRDTSVYRTAIAMHPDARGQGHYRPIASETAYWWFYRCPLDIQAIVNIVDTSLVPKIVSPSHYRTIHTEGNLVYRTVTKEEDEAARA